MTQARLSLLGRVRIAALDLNWDEPDERNLALGMVLDLLEQVETHIQAQPKEIKDHPVVRSSIDAARQVEAQDVEVDIHGEVKLRTGVAPSRRISIEDEQMRHGRKSRTSAL